ncbi:hypothetical protein BRARA_H00550 [Brassica rapa]|uniref:Plastocyanin-like domain-containing protein n=1 Tax=Brassica campestris TaxID=3711 RepID=A0A397YIL5_BRACM|nr:monocopper oxidase-like protein SKS1 [Brassica rapa]RID49772.1 hypothetical protein BRARA_H00550 [Brassica rapa]RID49773.1 hypothetical protein BRARA_H00550 [Brassica rapa]
MGSFQDLCLMLRPTIMLLLESKLNEPLLLTWPWPPGIQMRRNLWQDGLLGTHFPIPLRWNFTYQFQVEDQIGSLTAKWYTQYHKENT